MPLSKFKKRNIPEKFSRFIKFIYLKTFRINDAPWKISLGFGLGVFTGIMPGIGPLVALLLAIIFRVNRASAVLGSLIFNTWTGVISFLLAVKIGASLMGLSYQGVYDSWNLLLKNFNWQNLFQASVIKTLLPIALGYLFISFFTSAAVAAVIYFIAKARKRRSLARPESHT